MSDTVKNMSVQKDGFPNDTLTIKRKDHVCFIQSGTDAPSTVTVPSTLFENGVTSCVVNEPNAHDKTTYKVVGPDGDYTVNLPSSLKAIADAGTIKVNG
ncbi:MAG TPA: hypothetical protein VJ623_01180 [Holophagaceae bacterium]|nr:hypothetical protein [Holophagaceae bacterium]